jgi:hypothetical protein
MSQAEDKSAGDAISELRRISGELHDESARIQVQGRALSREEQERVRVLNEAGALIDRAVKLLDDSPGRF